MSDTSGTADGGSNASGNQDDSAETYDIVDSGQSEDIENSLTGQGVSDRETVGDIEEAGSDAPDARATES